MEHAKNNFWMNYSRYAVFVLALLVMLSMPLIWTALSSQQKNIEPVEQSVPQNLPNQQQFSSQESDDNRFAIEVQQSLDPGQPDPNDPSCTGEGYRCMNNDLLNECYQASTEFACTVGDFCCVQTSPSCATNLGGQCYDPSNIETENIRCDTSYGGQNGVCQNSGHVCCVNNPDENSPPPSDTTPEPLPSPEDIPGPDPVVPPVGGSSPAPSPTPGGTSPLCGGEFYCDACPSGSGAQTQQCYRKDNNQPCLTQSCSNDSSNPIFNKTCTNTPQCTGNGAGQMGFQYEACTNGSQCTGVGGGGCGYCQTASSQDGTPVNYTPTPTTSQSSGQASCTATYNFTDNPAGNTTMNVTVDAQTTNLRCVVLQLDGVFDQGKVSCASTIAGKYECTVNSGAAGTHTMQLKFGQQSVYTSTPGCGQEVICNSQTFTTQGAGAQSASVFGDVTGDNQVDNLDYTVMTACIGDSSCIDREKIDLNQDGLADMRDYNLLVSRIINVK